MNYNLKLLILVKYIIIKSNISPKLKQESIIIKNEELKYEF